MNPPAVLPFITAPLRDTAAWATAFDQTDIPVLTATAQCIEEWRANEDAADAHLLAESLADDPLMTLKVLRHVAARRSSRALTDPETVTAAIVLLGITPFFESFKDLPTIEARLAEHPDALAGISTVLRRSHRAARFALGFAVHRMDHDAAVIHEAALLHDFAEMLLWAHAPSLALQIRSLQEANPEMRTAAAQRSVLGVRLADVQQALMLQWRLPELLVRISNDHVSTAPQVRNVQLAIRVARHSSHSWDNPALPDDLAELSNLLNLSPPHVQQLLLELDN